MVLVKTERLAAYWTLTFTSSSDTPTALSLFFTFSKFAENMLFALTISGGAGMLHEYLAVLFYSHCPPMMLNKFC